MSKYLKKERFIGTLFLPAETPSELIRQTIVDFLKFAEDHQMVGPEDDVVWVL